MHYRATLCPKKLLKSVAYFPPTSLRAIWKTTLARGFPVRVRCEQETFMTVLTDAAIRAAKPYTTVWDSNLRGFGLSTGKARKSFIVLVGSGRRHTIGHYPLMTLS